MEFIVVLWFAIAIIVGVAANTRGRNGGGWFILAIVISPLIAGLLLLALPRQEKSIVPAWPGLLGFTPSNLRLREQAKQQERIDREWKAGIFRPDGMVGGVPYRMLPNGKVDALIQGGRVRFESLDHMRSMVNGSAPQTENVSPESVVHVPEPTPEWLRFPLPDPTNDKSMASAPDSTNEKIMAPAPISWLIAIRYALSVISWGLALLFVIGLATSPAKETAVNVILAALVLMFGIGGYFLWPRLGRPA